MNSKKDFEYSVLMGVYHKNDPEFLKTAIDSLLNQTIPPEEYFIAVDGPVGDELQKILDDYQSRYGEVFTIKYFPVNRGIGAVMKDTLPLCRNEFIARMDADDYSVPERIEKELAVFESDSECVWVGSNVDEFIDDMEHPVSHVIMPETNEEILKFGRRRCPFRQPTLLFKKSAVIAAGGYRDFHRHEDYDLIERMLHNERDGGNGYNIQEVLVYVRISRDFYRRRGGVQLALEDLKVKADFLRKGYISFADFIISGFGLAFVALMPGAFIEWFYKKFLRS